MHSHAAVILIIVVAAIQYEQLCPRATHDATLGKKFNYFHFLRTSVQRSQGNAQFGEFSNLQPSQLQVNYNLTVGKNRLETLLESPTLPHGLHNLTMSWFTGKVGSQERMSSRAWSDTEVAKIWMEYELAGLWTVLSEHCWILWCNMG